jgi:hypothetical protein
MEMNSPTKDTPKKDLALHAVVLEVGLDKFCSMVHAPCAEGALALTRRLHPVMRDPRAKAFRFESEHIEGILFNDDYTFI